MLTSLDKSILRQAKLNPDNFNVDVQYGYPRNNNDGRSTVAVLYPLNGMPPKQARETSEPGVTSFMGTALCRAGDQFIKKVGRAKAVGRAVASYLDRYPNS